ncbi:hypothetical protein RND81_03G206600 [Saponaria officinalis]|uniref:Uncharacterized protein n=1 Tax=Saponaria officinalis TaxID=3572 RepID=A0AAW1M1U7_SAPOF
MNNSPNNTNYPTKMIKIKRSIMVRPSKDTPKGTLWLSRVDMFLRTPYSHTTKFFIYQPKFLSQNYDTNIFISALSKVLVPFYPLAGRLRLNATKDRYEIDCNAEGVLFVEADTTLTIADLGDFRPSVGLRTCLTPSWDYSSSELESIPLEMLQLTRFKCGGVALGYASHHHVADGTSHAQFLYSLCRVAKGLDLVVPPIHDRMLHFSPRDPPRVGFSHSEFDPLGPSLSLNGPSGETETTQSIFILSKEQINTLKQQVISESHHYKTDKPTTYEVLAAHICRSTCKTRGLDHNQDVKLYTPVDGRHKLKNPPLPKGYFGNVLFFTFCKIKACDIIHKPLWYIVHKIQEAKKHMSSEEYLRSGTDYLESLSGLPDPLIGAQKSMYPNILVNSWARLPFDSADFGLGPPTFCGNCEVKLEGLCFLVTSPSGDGSVSLAINLFAQHMPLFEKYFYDFLPIKSNL